MEDVSQLMFGASSPAACWAAHLSLAASNLHFKVVGRAPLSFLPREASEIAVLRQQKEIQAKASSYLLAKLW